MLHFLNFNILELTPFYFLEVQCLNYYVFMSFMDASKEENLWKIMEVNCNKREEKMISSLLLGRSQIDSIKLKHVIKGRGG